MDGPNALDFVWVGFVDEFEIVHELCITQDGIPTAKARGWMVLTDDALGMLVFNPPRMRGTREDA